MALAGRDLVAISDLTNEEMEGLFTLADEMARYARGGTALASGKIMATLFYEPSTRTRMSFESAMQRLGGGVVSAPDMVHSSVAKGETIADTVRTVESYADLIVIRHPQEGAARVAADYARVPVVNGGDGPHEHPTQGLLDIMTIRQRLGRIAGLTVAMVGDIAHSRTARSNIWGLKKLGAQVIVCGPSTLVSPRWQELGVEYSYSLDAILPRVDVLNLLRIQFERQYTRPFPSVREYALLYGMDSRRLARTRPNILILAPGPINRGVEVTPDVADGPQSAILDQVTNGVAVRMAVLWLLTGK